MLVPTPPVAAAPNRNLAFSRALFEELLRGGVRHVCVCPGSRSAALAMACAATPGLRVWTHVDERSAAFFALGLAKASRTPVALVCTSGTAAANFLPAIVEANLSRVPLLALTADRPAELRECGAPQTIDQVRLFGTHVRWYAEAPLPEPTDAGLRQVRALASRAVAEATGPTPGPVHLNLPFREPLDPRAVAADAARDATPLAISGRAPAPFTRVVAAVADASPDLVSELAGLVRAHERGVIAVGPLDLEDDAIDAIAALGVATGWPIVAEPAAQLRSGAHAGRVAVLATADWLLRDAGFARAHAPDIVLRFGPMPTSKAFRLWIERDPPAHHVVVDPGAGWEDPLHAATAIVRADPVRLATRLVRRLGVSPAVAQPSAWLSAWRAADAAAARVVAEAGTASASITTPALVRALAGALPDGATLYVSNSMAVRDLDCFWPAGERRVRVLANRGANGIDGILSSALGAAAAGQGPVALLIGDLAFLHDVGALVAARRHRLPLVIVAVNDDGGGIFSLLPVAAHGERAHFDALFRVPHGMDLAAAARGFGIGAVRVGGEVGLRNALATALAADATTVLEVPLDRARDVALRRTIERDVAAALAESVAAA
ncbi:MAG: 2-succinyl-5-enolpyruvyl-6-hydroxy-3-cyclohexene-1-carboxylic-acid synthase [Myxococcota bacterium]|nr:2-succinyl-5-enolpyruvyl-6-hydroxy-3-cyclohexene-1-carboxylic-acid synthase [Myxococcota bacterium]